MPPIQFGTSGWRGILAEDFTFAGVRVVTAAILRYVKESGLAGRPVGVGYDTRFLSSEAFAREAAAGLAASGLPVYLCTRDTPTPVLAVEIVRQAAAGGLNITASHNPPEYYGIKFSMDSGGPALPEVTAAIEAEANRLDGAKLLLEEGSWVLLRPSGTEAMVRLYVEAPSRERLDALEAAGRGLLDSR